jgi:hypothetical protein
MSTVFESIPLEVLRVELPLYAAALLKFLRKQLGFRYEAERVTDAATAARTSRKHKATLYKGNWQDALLLSVTRDEFAAFRMEMFAHERSQGFTPESGEPAHADPAGTGSPR